MAMVHFSPICPAVGSLWQAAKIFSCSSRVLTNLNSSTCIATYTFIHVSRCRKRRGEGELPIFSLALCLTQYRSGMFFIACLHIFGIVHVCVRVHVMATKAIIHVVLLLIGWPVTLPGENCTGTCTCHMYVIHMQPCINVKVALVLFLQLCVCG